MDARSMILTLVQFEVSAAKDEKQQQSLPERVIFITLFFSIGPFSYNSKLNTIIVLGNTAFKE